MREKNVIFGILPYACYMPIKETIDYSNKDSPLLPFDLSLVNVKLDVKLDFFFLSFLIKFL